MADKRQQQWVEYNVETVRTWRALSGTVTILRVVHGRDYQEQMNRYREGMMGDLTLYAKWALAEYAITYDLGGRQTISTIRSVYN